LFPEIRFREEKRPQYLRASGPHFFFDTFSLREKKEVHSPGRVALTCFYLSFTSFFFLLFPLSCYFSSFLSSFPDVRVFLPFFFSAATGGSESNWRGDARQKLNEEEAKIEKLSFAPPRVEPAGSPKQELQRAVSELQVSLSLNA